MKTSSQGHTLIELLVLLLTLIMLLSLLLGFGTILYSAYTVTSASPLEEAKLAHEREYFETHPETHPQETHPK